MAYVDRTIEELQADMLNAIQADSTLSVLFGNTSQTSFQYLFTFIVAVAQSIQEKSLVDQEAALVQIAADAIVGTPAWIKAKALEFQYSTTNPQQLKTNDNYSIAYPTIDESLRVVSQAAVQQLVNKVVLVKVLSGTAPNFSPLTDAQIVAFTQYMDALACAGTSIATISVNPDQLKLNMSVYYSGQIDSGLILQNVIDAIVLYITNLEFDGAVLQSKIVDAAQSVPYVKDVTLDSLFRSDATSNFVSFIQEYRISNLYSGAVDVQFLTDYLEANTNLIAQ